MDIENGQLREIPAWDVKMVRSKYDVISQAKKDGKTVSSLRECDGPLSLEERRACKKTPEIQGASCATVRQHQRRRKRQSSIHGAASASQMPGAKFLNPVSKLPGYAWRNK